MVSKTAAMLGDAPGLLRDQTALLFPMPLSIACVIIGIGPTRSQEYHYIAPINENSTDKTLLETNILEVFVFMTCDICPVICTRKGNAERCHCANRPNNCQAQKNSNPVKAKSSKRSEQSALWIVSWDTHCTEYLCCFWSV